MVNAKINRTKDAINAVGPLNDELREPFDRTIEVHETIRWGIESGGNIKVLQYKIQDVDNARNIYFLEDRVFLYNNVNKDIKAPTPSAKKKVWSN